MKKEYISNLIYADVYNSYGPTEASICATYHLCTEEDPDLVPIGKPIDGYSIYILNRYNELQPVSVPGEICISYNFV